MTMRTGLACVTVPSDGMEVNQFAPSAVTRPDWNVRGVALVLWTSTVCELGDSPPAAPAKIKPVGCTSGPILLPGCKTLRTIETNCGVLSASGAETCTVP